MAYADYLHCEGCDTKVIYWPDDDPPALGAVFCGNCWKGRYSFTRDQLIDALTKLEAYPATLKSGRVILLADSMADALIEALEDRSEEKHDG